MRRVGALALLCAALSTCSAGNPTASSDAECKARSTCRTHGRCSLDYQTKKCVVGSDDDCAQSNLCHKENMCRKVDDSCRAQ